MTEQQPRQLMGSQHGLMMCGPTDEKSARTIAQHWSSQAKSMQTTTTAATMETETSSASAKKNVQAKEHKKEVHQHEEPRKSSSKLKSPEEGVIYPDSRAVYAKEKEGAKAVFGVRTYPDSFEVQKEAGSIWVTPEEAKEANKLQGAMKVFSKHEDICENIADAAHWIKSQVNETSQRKEKTTDDSTNDADIAAEFEERMKKAREKRMGKKSTEPAAERHPQVEDAEPLTGALEGCNCCEKSGMHDRGGCVRTRQCCWIKLKPKCQISFFQKERKRSRSLRTDCQI